MSLSTASLSSRTPVTVYSSSSCPELSYTESPPEPLEVILRKVNPVDPGRMETDKAFWDRNVDKMPRNRHELHTLTMKRLHSRFPPLHAIHNPVQKLGFPLMTARYLLLVSGVNSLTQRIYTWLKDAGLGTTSLSVVVYSPGKNSSPLKEEELLLDVDRFAADVILCPYLTTKVPSVIYEKVSLIMCPVRAHTRYIR